MAANAATTAHAPLVGAPARIPVRRPARRSLLAIAAATALALALTNLGALTDAAHAACTAGTEPGTTCGEALYAIGFPA